MTNEEKYKTYEERAEAFYKFCDDRNCISCPCSKVHDEDTGDCSLLWLTLEVVEEKPLPCPFCGCSDVGVYGHSSLVQMKYAQCKGCDSQGAVRATVDEAIKAWNRRV